MTSFIKDEVGRVNGVGFEDALTGRKHEARAAAVINATGVFCDRLRKMSESQAAEIVTLSQGVHLVFDRSFLPGGDALMIPKTGDGRVLCGIPWHITSLGHDRHADRERGIGNRARDTEIEFILATAHGIWRKMPRREGP